MPGLRVIGGIAKGKKLKSRKVKNLRPATDYLKEALFNILGLRVCESYFLDLFAGTGSIGIEALSRGAEKAVFVEKNPLHASLIKQNLEITNFSDHAEVYVCDVLKGIPILKSKGYKFSLIFVDPPFCKGLIEPTLNLLYKSDILFHDGMIIARSAKGENINFDKNPARQERYGDSVLRFYVYD